MGYYSVLPFFGVLGLALLLAGSKPFSALDAGLARHNLGPLDGLRGFLALGVFGHHLALTIGWLQRGVWVAPDTFLYTYFGHGCVAMFFMITAYLFWGRLVDGDGTLPWKRFYLGRLFRIAPLYLLAIVLLLAAAFAKTGFLPKESPAQLLRECGTWLSLGIPADRPDVNGLRLTWQLMAGVTWSLHYEWWFYFALPLFAPFARRGRHMAFAVAGLGGTALAWFFTKSDLAACAGLFFAGMLIASASRLSPRWDWTHPAWSAAGLAALGLPPLAYPFADSPFPSLCLTFFVFLVVQGNSLFGVLTWKAARRLGVASYSLYLLHGLVITAVLALPGLRALAMRGPLQYWALGLAMTLVLVTVASLTFFWVERPGMAWGARMAPKPGPKPRT